MERPIGCGRRECLGLDADRRASLPRAGGAALKLAEMTFKNHVSTICPCSRSRVPRRLRTSLATRPRPLYGPQTSHLSASFDDLRLLTT